jgi:DNA-binding MarR family transcriptional regulator
MTAKPTKAAPSAAAPHNMGVLEPLIGFRMRRIHAHLTRNFSASLGEAALKPGGFSALGLIASNPGLSQQMLSQALGQDKATVVALLDELEQRGWAVRRRGVKDRRRHDLHVTEAGEAALAHMAEAAALNERAIVSVLSSEDFDTLLRLLDELYHGCFQAQD